MIHICIVINPAVSGKVSSLSAPPRKRGIVTLAVWGDGGPFSCFLWLPGHFESVQTRFEDSPGRKKPRKNQKMIVKIGENPKWCLGVAAPSHTLCAEDVRRKAEQNCGDVNGRCGAVPLKCCLYGAPCFARRARPAAGNRGAQRVHRPTIGGTLTSSEMRKAERH